MKTGNVLYGLGVAGSIAAAGALAWYHDLPGVLQGARESEAEVEVLEQRREEVLRQEADLRRQVEDLNEESLELEAAIRAGKGHVREGETVYRIEWPEAADTGKDEEVL